MRLGVVIQGTATHLKKKPFMPVTKTVLHNAPNKKKGHRNGL